MSQERFEAAREAAWTRFEADLVVVEQADKRSAMARGAATPGPVGAADFPAQYRRLCQDLALARRRRYAAPLIDRLNRLALRGHQRLYRSRSLRLRDALDYAARGFPAAVRAEWRLALLAAVLFFGPLAGMWAAVTVRPELVELVMDPISLAQFEAMYDPAAAHQLRPREVESDLLMFGFYIRNNVGIAFRTFGGGVLLGLGSLFFLVYNGLAIGAAAGHITVLGFGETFFPFTIGHGAFELTAICLAGMITIQDFFLRYKCLAGMTGLKVGFAGLSPGRRTRSRALVEEARGSVGLIAGFAGMLIVAAALEAFWSSAIAVPAQVRIGVGVGLWALVFGWLGFAGRGRGA